jgi:ATP-dependent RNA helicase DeaD
MEAETSDRRASWTVVVEVDSLKSPLKHQEIVLREPTESSSTPVEAPEPAEPVLLEESPIEASDLPADDPAPSGVDYVSDRTFADFALSPELLHGIEERGYKVATPVQVAAIEPGIAGCDLIVRAKTGTGKTAAFCIPMLERLAGGERVPKALVLTPTRELALQGAEECVALARYKDIRVCVLYGGVPIGPQTQALQDGVEFVVGTPGRIIDHIRRGNLDLSKVETVCLDEADEMLSMGFLEEVTQILDRIPPKPQVLLFSATVSDKLSFIVRKYLRDPESIMLSTDADRVEGIRHILYETSPDIHKVRALLAILAKEQPASALIFCNTREDAATVASFLDRQGLDAQLISGELPQSRREAVMTAMKAGQIQFLVATDVAARGIDISNLSHVINYSLPEDPAIYLHRTGRTGRIGKTGTALSLAGGTDLSTRNVLERDYAIDFELRPLPSQDEASRLATDRQAALLKAATGVMAFESFIGTVRDLKERPDGDMLLAVALRAFFLWDRQRRAEAAGETENAEGRNQGPDRHGDRGPGDRGSRGDGDRTPRPEGERSGPPRGDFHRRHRRPKRGPRNG